MKAFVLVQTQNGSQPLAAALRSIPGIEWTDNLTGAFDAIALARAESMRDLLETVVERIRELPGVTRALPAALVRSLSALVPGGEEAA
ncbi:MAG TPA: Lrp/AsnC ligand binding domain-containing protein [Actinomycetota bacterium]